MSRTYTGENRREHCPVESCGQISELIDKNKILSKRVTGIGTVSLVILGLVVSVLLAMSNRTLDLAQKSAEEMKEFMKGHSISMLEDEKIHTSTLYQLDTLQKQMLVVSEIQLAVVQEVSILKKGKVK